MAEQTKAGSVAEGAIFAARISCASLRALAHLAACCARIIFNARTPRYPPNLITLFAYGYGIGWPRTTRCTLARLCAPRIAHRAPVRAYISCARSSHRASALSFCCTAASRHSHSFPLLATPPLRAPLPASAYASRAAYRAHILPRAARWEYRACRAKKKIIIMKIMSEQT